MPTLFCFGLGYTATHYVATFHSHFDRVSGTVRNGTRAAEMNQGVTAGGKPLKNDGIFVSPLNEFLPWGVRCGVSVCGVVIRVVRPRRGCRRARGLQGRFAPLRGALRAFLTAAAPDGFGTRRPGRRSGPL